MADDVQLYAHVEKFGKIQCSLLNAELEEEKKGFQYDVTSPEIGVLEKKGVLIKDVQVCDVRSEFGASIVEFTRTSPKKPTDPLAFYRGDVVSIWFHDAEAENKKTCLATGTIIRVSDIIKISFDNSCPFKWDFEKKYFILKTISEITYRRMKKASKNMLNHLHGRCSMIMRNLFANVKLEKNPLHPNLVNGKGELKLYNKNLNLTQKEAVQFCLEQKNIAIVHGPPGTGKTTVLIEVILQLANSGQKVLVCAPSNIAVDIYVERLNPIKSKVIRTGKTARMLETVKDSSLEAAMSRCNEGFVLKAVKGEMAINESKLKSADRRTKEHLREEIRDLKSEFFTRQARMVQDFLKNAKVVLSTLVSASDDGDFKHLPSEHFDVVIIDECSQAIEAACWIVIPKAPKLILAGDHLQLPPTIRSVYAIKHGLGVSLMERAIAVLGTDGYKLLTHQYRMNTSIMQWVNASFYANKLVADESVANCLLKDLPGVKDSQETETPLLWVDTAGFGDQEREFRGSKCNDTEGDVVAVLVKRLVDAGIQQNDLAIITPYSLQVECIKSKISNFPDVEVRTVDGFQGREKQAVIISLVRANEQKELGFLTDERRLNVAVSRAQFFLAVIGDSSTIRINDLIKGLWNYIEEHGVYYTAHELSKDIDELNLPVFASQSQKAKKKKSKRGKRTKKAGESASDVNKSIHETEPVSEIKENVHFKQESVSKVKKIAHFEEKSSSDKTKSVHFEKKSVSDVKKPMPEVKKMVSDEKKITSNIKEISSSKDCTGVKETEEKGKVNVDDQEKIIKDARGARPKEILKSKIKHASKSGKRPEQDSTSDEESYSSEEICKTDLETDESEKEEKQKMKMNAKQSKTQKKKNLKTKNLDDLGEFDEFDSDLKAIQESKMRNSSCFVKGCNSYSKLLLQLCEHCHETFCFTHLLPEVHGCGEAAKRAARHAFKTFPSGKPSGKSRDKDRKIASMKLKEKVAQMASERKRQSKK